MVRSTTAAVQRGSTRRLMAMQRGGNDAMRLGHTDLPVSHYEPQTPDWGRPRRGLSAAVTIGTPQPQSRSPFTRVSTVP
eukprot:351528-Chlamydomonas_euryale.AAC.2